MQILIPTLRKKFSLINILAISLLGGYIIYYATFNGPWGFSDSAAYLVSARNFVRGIGLGYYYPNGEFHILTFYPPLYPLILGALYGLLKIDIVIVARGLCMVLYILAIIGVGLIFDRFSKFNILTMAGVFVFAIFPPVLTLFSSAMSEPLFIFLLVWAVYALLSYWETSSPGWFVASAILTGMVSLTRYIGISLSMSMLICVLLFETGAWRVRLKKIIFYGFLCGSMLLAWLMWTHFNTTASVVAEIGRAHV